MNIGQNDLAWTTKKATLSHKTAQKEYGLTFQEIVAGIRCGKLQYRETSMYGNPYLKLIRQQVEALVSEKYGADYLQQKQFKTELAEVNKTLGVLKTQTRALEIRKAELLELLGN